MTRWFAILLAGAVSVPRLAFACSGPGAAAAIERHERFGWTTWIVALLLAGAVLAIPRVRALGARKLSPLVVLALLHPAWWMSARSGDCGGTLYMASFVMTALVVLVGCILLIAALRRG